MNQRTHAWLAIRAVKLLEDSKEVRGLVKLLKPHVRTAAIGAWIPDLQDSKRGSGDIDNHVLKMELYDGLQKIRFTASKDEMLKRLGPGRLMTSYLKADSHLTSQWWQQPYKASPQPGQHLGNRAMALSVTIIDLLILGDPPVARLVPGAVKFAESLDPEARSAAEQIATYFFMLSHFLADSCMPCHCDARPLSAYAANLHHELETRWSKKVGTYFDKSKLLKCTDTPDAVMAKARSIDSQFGYKLPVKIPKLPVEDVWKDVVNVCRGSFAVANILAPVKDYPLDTDEKPSLDKIIKDYGEQHVAKIDKVAMHDAIVNIALTWKHIWQKFR
ncbi:MAG: hypothetical protein AB1483_00550 [Candidatus Zixiibacteriota bacterium]